MEERNVLDWVIKDLFFGGYIAKRRAREGGKRGRGHGTKLEKVVS